MDDKCHPGFCESIGDWRASVPFPIREPSKSHFVNELTVVRLTELVQNILVLPVNLSQAIAPDDLKSMICPIVHLDILHFTFCHRKQFC
jgi:hypothetical protein